MQFAASMGKASAKLKELLPYPLENVDGRPRLPADVATTLRGLVQSRILPMPIMAFLMEDLERANLLC